ncbi:MAG: LysR family transcriptional regulator [Alphaproteobacteria bacterium]|nr:LysR family transcriptional regulator [Alphaproteobacteria bacterium]
MDLVACQMFVTTVDAGSITAAAARLGLSRPTLSRRLAALEDALGIALLHRTTRKLTPTPTGLRLYRRLQPLLREVDGVTEALHAERDGVVGRLVVSVPPAVADEVAVLLVHLMREHPHLETELRSEVGLTDLRDGEVEVALRAGRLDDPDLVQRRLGARPVRAVATPAYLREHGTPMAPEDLAVHALLLGLHPDGTPRTAWPLRDGRWLPVAGRLRTADQNATLAACLADGGIALLSEPTYASALDAGRLAFVLPDQVGTDIELHAVFARRTLQPARVRAFVDAAVAWFRR